MDKKQIYVLYGDNPERMGRTLAEEADLAAMIGDRNRRVVLKPNLVNATPPSQGATTHPEIAVGVIQYLRNKGFRNFLIAEGSWIGESTAAAFRAVGYDQISRELNVPLLDTKKDKARKAVIGGVEISLCAFLKEEDFLINLPVLKGHCQTVLTCALKNLKGLIPDSEKRRYHTMGLHKPIACLNGAIRQDFILVDAICGDLDFEEGGNPVAMHMMYAAADPVLCDAFACSLLGIRKEEVPYIQLAESLRIGSGDLEKAEIKRLNKSERTGGFTLPRKAGQYAAYMEENNACSACCASLIHGLSRTGRRPKGKISVGQGFRGKTGKLGSGDCCRGFERHVPGCPPSGQAIIEFLEELE